MSQTKRWMKGLSIFLLITAWAFLTPSLTHAGVTVSETNLGQATVGTPITWTLVASLTSGTQLYVGWWFDLYNNPCGFEITQAPADKDTSPSTSIEISWTPSEWQLGEQCSPTLQISDGGMFTLANVELVVQVVPASEPETPDVGMLLQFFDESVVGKKIVGSGSGKSADHRLNAFRNMIVEAGNLVQNGYVEEASGQLMACRKKINVFVKANGSMKAGGVGEPEEAIEELANMIDVIVASLRSE